MRLRTCGPKCDELRETCSGTPQWCSTMPLPLSHDNPQKACPFSPNRRSYGELKTKTELPPLVPGRSQLPQLKGTLAGSRGTKHPNLTASASTFPDDLRRRALVRSANVTVEPPRSAMKRQTGLSRSTTNKSVTFLPVSQSTAFEPSLEESLISRPLTPPLPLPTKSPNHSLRTYARSVFYPESGASAPHPRPHPPRLSVAPENSVRAATFAFTSTPRPGHEHSRNVLVHKAGQPIARVDADLSGHDEDEHENSSQISSIVDAQQSISALSRSAVRQSLKLSRTREALDRALRDQSRSEGSSDNRGSNQATRRFDVSNLVSEKTSPNQVDLGISSSSKPRPRRSSASGVCQANISPKHIPNDVEVDASNSLERSWAKASFVEQELSPDDMFARRMRDNYLLDGIDLSKSDSRRTKHSVTGFYLSEPPIVHLPSTSHQAGRAVRPQARILNTVPEKRPAAMQNLTLPREFTFTNRTRPRVEPDHTRPAKVSHLNKLVAHLSF